jgi:hypothetical protein
MPGLCMRQSLEQLSGRVEAPDLKAVVGFDKRPTTRAR